MKAAIFNIHDVALFLLAAECSMLAMLFSIYRRLNVCRLLLVLFLFFNALIPLDALIFWGEEVRRLMFDAFPNVFFLLGLSVFLEGPVLYWFTRAAGGDFTFKPHDALHFVPAVLALAYLYLVYYRYPLPVQRELVVNFGIFDAPGAYFSVFVTFQKGIVILYGAMCLLLVAGRRSRPSRTQNRPALIWLRLLIGGFLSVWIWVFMAHLVGMHSSGDFSDLMGILGNYLILILVNLLLFYSFIHPEIIANLGVNADRLNNGPVSAGHTPNTGGYRHNP